MTALDMFLGVAIAWALLVLAAVHTVRYHVDMTEGPILREVLPEHVVANRRLGRHVIHDPRSKRYPAPEAPVAASVIHAFAHGLPLDQGQLGSCTGNAATGMMATEPFETGAFVPDEKFAVEVYSEATRLDGYRGVYPPDDTGSSGLAVCKALKKKGLLSSYAHCFGLEHMQKTLTLQAVIIGIGWYSGFDTPDKNGLVEATGQIRGGHEVLVFGQNIESEYFLAMNSWGPSWGLGGEFKIPFSVMQKLLAEKGDVTTGIR